MKRCHIGSGRCIPGCIQRITRRQPPPTPAGGGQATQHLCSPPFEGAQGEVRADGAGERGRACRLIPEHHEGELPGGQLLLLFNEHAGLQFIEK
jgi:hypothetical protein